MAAIVAADVAEYSRLVRADEEGTLRALRAHRQELTDPLIEQFGGRIANTAGDSLLLEFPSAVEAVRCALAIQAGMAERNSDVDPERQINFRIGINVGDVVAEGDDLLGDGVNVAARLEALAEPGGICLSRTARGQVRDQLDLDLEDLGEVEVKNIARPVRVFRATATPDVLAALASATVVPPAPQTVPRRKLYAAAAIVAALLILAGGGVFWWWQQPDFEPADPAKMAHGLPDKPSIAVLPFAHMSDDPKQEYFSDGITEDIITDLSNVSGLFVIARNSSFKFKGKSVDVRDVARDLGVRYVLEGSVRKATDRIRISAQLIDAATGHHLWAERYDRDLKDVFALQDEIAGKIVKALEVRLTEDEQQRVARRYTDSLEAYDYFLRGRGYRGGQTKEANAQARRLLERATELDPKFAGAYAELSLIRFVEWWVHRPDEPQVLERAFELAQKAVVLDASLPLAHANLGWLYMWRKRQYDRAIAEGQRAIAIDPNYADGYLFLGEILTFASRPEEAIGLSMKGMRLDPHSLWHYLLHLGHSDYLMGQHEEALANLKRSVTLNPDYPATHLWLAASYIELGREEEARAAVAEVLRLSPRASLQFFRQNFPYKDPAVLQRFLDDLRKAGMPEKSSSTAP